MDNINNNESVVTTENLLKRAYIFLEDGNWPMADRYFDSCLDREPESADAYLGKMLASYRLKGFEELINLYEPFDSHPLYHRIVKYADAELNEKLSSCLVQIKARKEIYRKSGIMNNAKSLMALNNPQSYCEAIAILSPLNGWKGSDELINQCKDGIIALARSQMNDTVTGCQQAASLLEAVRGYGDADSLIKACNETIDELRKKEEEAAKEAEILRGKRNKKILRALVIASVTVIILAVFASISIKESNYRNGVSLIDEGRYDEAYDIFIDLGDYKESAEYLILSKNGKKYDEALALLESEQSTDHNKAYEILNELGDFKDAKELLAGFRYVIIEEIVEGYYGADFTRVYKYDENGRLTERITDSNMGSYYYDYDSEGRLVTEYMGPREDNWDTTYTYHDNGSIKTKKYLYSQYQSGKREYITITLDEKGIPITKEFYAGNVWSFDFSFSDGSVTSLVCKNTDKDGNVTETNQFDFDSSYGEVSVYLKKDGHDVVICSKKDNTATEYIINKKSGQDFFIDEYRTVEYNDEGIPVKYIRALGGDKYETTEYVYGYTYAPSK